MQIELAMMTTALNTGRPFRFPFMSNDLYFKREDFARLLPQAVVEWMVAKARDCDNARKLSQVTGQQFLALPWPPTCPCCSVCA